MTNIQNLQICFSLFLILCISCSSKPDPSSFLLIEPPTIEQEASSVWQTIHDIDFFEQQGYEVNLPDHQLIDSLIGLSKAKQFGNDQYQMIYNLLESGIYQPEDYSSALSLIRKEETLINQLIQKIESEKSNWDWTFKSYDQYPIVLTLYGSGGSYNPETGQVNIFTTTEGAFKAYKNPANTIIHEIVHIGMETSIVQKWKLPHGLKERIIDRFVFLHFADALPNYTIQNMGDVRIDEVLKQASDFNALDKNLAQFLNQK